MHIVSLCAKSQAQEDIQAKACRGGAENECRYQIGKLTVTPQASVAQDIQDQTGKDWPGADKQGIGPAGKGGQPIQKNSDSQKEKGTRALSFFRRKQKQQKKK